ncbi:hypothetical protein [Frisingicoccus sp.]|uniref:preprotein translocase subunit SecA n=1 Tax=Frisingicoccus sp. TaxID=1918627 RepID=UPI00399C16F2
MSNKKKLKKTADKIYDIMEKMKTLTDDELKAKTEEFKIRLKNGESMNHILPEAYAAIGEASYRTIGLRPYKVQFMGATALHYGKVVEQSTGEGKAVTLDTLIPSPAGWKLAGDINVGDIIFNRHGKPTRVEGVYPQGKKQIYEVHLADGRIVETADEHLWSVYAAGTPNKLVTLTTADMMKKGIRSGRAFRFHIPLNDAVEYDECKLPINPYVLGVFLGMSSSGISNKINLANKYEVVLEDLKDILCVEDSIKEHRWSEFGDDIKDMISTGDIFIPDVYLTASIRQRWELLNGIFDIGGHIDGYGSYKLTFKTCFSGLCSSIREIIFSLGMSCVVRKKDDIYTLIIVTDGKRKEKFFKNVTSKKKKAKLAVENSRTRAICNMVAVKDIVLKNEYTEMVCFRVDDDEHLFLCGDYVVTHNTLVAAMPAYLNALEGKGVHVVTVNDYLAERDASDIGRIHNFMGLSVGCILKTTSPEQKKKEYAKDITYITNTELGFDYLRDNMAQRAEDRMQRGHHYCIIDEVDSILIDEARTPLIISGPGGKPTKLYIACNELVKKLDKGESIKELSKVDILSGERAEETGDYIVDEEHHNVTLTVQGIKKCEEYFGIANISDGTHTELLHNIIAALKANTLMHKDKDYVVKNGEIILVDAFTGRLQPGRRYVDGVHQAIEAKEGVTIQGETATYATVTYQNFFNKYKKKCGMTGTAYTEKKEFREIYNMSVIRIPTNKPRIRVDMQDKMFLNRSAKFNAVVEAIKKAHEDGQPVLVGTSTIQESEILDELLKDAGLPHTVLNAKYHEQEAEIISRAGAVGSITIATNMAGRGTDIKLDDEAKEAGGLMVIGTQRHESRRIDNQLQGRSGRQGDPGESVFYLSLDDEVLNLYGSDRMKHMMLLTGLTETECIEGNIVNKFVKQAQTIIEDNNFGARKNVMKFDRVNDQQRELIYGERNEILDKADTRKTMLAMIQDSIDMIIDKYSSEKYIAQDEYENICNDIEVLVNGIHVPEFPGKLEKKEMSELCYKAAEMEYQKKENDWPDINAFREFERQIILRCLDIKWMQHINDLEILRQNIALVGYGQKDPTVVYKIKAFDMFGKMMDEIKQDAVYNLFSSRLKANQ